MTGEDQVIGTNQIGTLEADRTYQYDTLDRLGPNVTLKDSNNWSAPASVTSTYYYDNLGNRTSHSDRGATAIEYSHDAANRLNDWGIVNTSTLHNAAGNQVKIPNVQGTALFDAGYDHLNRLTNISTPGAYGDTSFN